MIEDESEAERLFIESNDMSYDDGAYIPIVFMHSGDLMTTDLNDMAFLIDISAEDYISNYSF